MRGLFRDSEHGLSRRVSFRSDSLPAFPFLANDGFFGPSRFVILSKHLARHKHRICHYNEEIL